MLKHHLINLIVTIFSDTTLNFIGGFQIGFRGHCIVLKHPLTLRFQLTIDHTGRGLEKEQATASAWFVILTSVILTAAFWWVAS